jgi:hypothetical protein
MLSTTKISMAFQLDKQSSNIFAIQIDGLMLLYGVNITNTNVQLVTIQSTSRAEYQLDFNVIYNDPIIPKGYSLSLLSEVVGSPTQAY